MDRKKLLQELWMNDLLYYLDNNKDKKITMKGIWRVFKSRYHDHYFFNSFERFRKELIDYANHQNIVVFEQIRYENEAGEKRHEQKIVYKQDDAKWGWYYAASRYRYFHRLGKKGVPKRATGNRLKEQEKLLADFCRKYPEMLKEKIVCYLFGMSVNSYYRMLRAYGPVKQKEIKEQRNPIKRKNEHQNVLLAFSRVMWEMPPEFTMEEFLLELKGIVDYSDPEVLRLQRKIGILFKKELNIRKKRKIIDGVRCRVYVKPDFLRDCSI